MIEKKRIIRLNGLFILLILLFESEYAHSAGFNVSCPMGLTTEFTCTVMKLPDLFLGGSIYYPVAPNKGLSCYSSFMMYAGRKTVIEKTGDAMYTQFKERRFIWDFGFDESVTFPNQVGFYVRGGLGCSHGWYKGSTAPAATVITPTLQAGVLFFFPTDLRFRLRFGYTYANACTSGPHGVSVSFQFGGSCCRKIRPE